MKNPWNTISLCDYESHMKLQSVMQLQTLNEFMKSQFESLSAKTAMVLGVAGGNGLEHVQQLSFSKVYAVDINSEYLQQCAKRFPDPVFEWHCLDLTEQADKLPHAELLIANLLIEYIGCECFVNIAQIVCPKLISCVIQRNQDNGFVSPSPYLHAFDCLDSVHRIIREDALKTALNTVGYKAIKQSIRTMPNGTSLIRLDFKK